jgi:hypothetical protein
MPFIFFIFLAKKNKSKDIKVFFVYTSLLFISIVAVLAFRYVIRSYQLFTLFDRFFIISEFALVSIFFFFNVVQLKIKKIIVFLIILFIIYSFYDFFTSIDNLYPYYPLALECLLLPLIIMLFFYEKMKFTTKFPIYTTPSFWIAVAFLIFSTGNFFLFLFSKLILPKGENDNLYNTIYGSFTILKNIFLCISVLISKNLKMDNIDPINNINLPFDPFSQLTNKN